MLDFLTPDEDAEFRERGFLLLKSVVSPEEIGDLLTEVKRLVADAQRLNTTFHEKYYHADSYKLVRILRLSSAFDRLIDHPGYFGKLVSMMGTHIQLMDGEIFVRGPADETITGFHTDLGLGLQKILPLGDNPFLEVKAQIFLTDLSERNSSNFALVPGSHRRRVSGSEELGMIDEINRQIGADGDLPRGAHQVLAAPGDVLLFPHSLWHGVAPNRSGRTRYSISLRYGQLALRPLERFDVVLDSPSRPLTPRQRRLLGDLGMDDPSPYRPSNQDALILGDEKK